MSWRLVAGIALLCFCAAAGAVEQLLFEAQRIEGRGWSLDHLQVNAEVAESDGLAVTGRIEQLALPPPMPGIRDLELHCPDFRLYQEGGSSCASAALEGRLEHWKQLSGNLAWQQGEAGFELLLEPLKLGRGRIEGRIQGGGQRLELDLQLLRLALEPLFRLLLPGWSGGGRLDASGTAGTDDGEHWHARWSLRTSGLDFSDAEGLRVGEKLTLALSVDGQWPPESGRSSLRALFHSGQLYIDPFYFEFDSAAPPLLEAQVTGSPAENRWRLHGFSGSYPGVFEFSGDGRLAAGELERLQLDFEVQELARAYPLLLQPLLIGTAADALEVTGRASGALAIAGGAPERFELKLEGVDLEEGSRLFGAEGLAGHVVWQRQGAGGRSRLGWRDAHLYRLSLGALDARFTARGNRLVVEPLALELLGGVLKMQDLRLEGLTEGEPAWQAGAELEKISLELLAKALEWPPLQGELNAAIPRVRYAQGRLRLEGALVVEVFGGRVVIEGLQVADLFGPAPVLETSIRLENLDLAQISRTFSFGRIEGSLEGHVRDLRLVAWELASFEALLRSPPRDKRRHRISQRAIENLTELGNGVAAGLSGTFLGMFKDFAYDRLELKIRLQGDTAELDGAPGPKGGYYIVKGARLPRVDVIGRNRRVAWKDLLSRIQGIRFEGVIVE